nr:MAG TPA: hypothetical protein [Caudoviricetes sp.]
MFCRSDFASKYTVEKFFRLRKILFGVLLFTTTSTEFKKSLTIAVLSSANHVHSLILLLLVFLLLNLVDCCFDVSLFHEVTILDLIQYILFCNCYFVTCCFFCFFCHFDNDFKN